MLPQLTKFITEIAATEESTILHLQDQHILLVVIFCDFCGGKMTRSGLVWRCTTKACRRAISVFVHSFFSGKRIKVNDALMIAYLWLANDTHISICEKTKFSPKTVTQFVSELQMLVGQTNQLVYQRIGGPGIVVEIDESKFGKRKYNRGHQVEGVWVVGGVEWNPERRIFLIPVENRNQDTLLRLIDQFVEPGSIVHTDLWRGYRLVEDNEMVHRTVNYSQYFVDPMTGVHTNTIEVPWAAIKAKIPCRSRTAEYVGIHLLEFIWRRNNKGNLWRAFLTALMNYDYGDVILY